MSAGMKEKKLDILHGSIAKGIPRFALPVAATAVLGQLFNAADIAVVGNFTGDAKTVAVAAVGANSPVIALILNLLLGIALGVTVVIANAIGRGDRKAARRAVHTAILVSLLGGVLVAAIGEGLASWIMHALQVPDEVYPYALLYLRIYLLGLPVILLYNFEAAIFRSAGETREPLIALALSGVLNVILNLFFVIVLRRTVDGVAIATVISNAVSAAMLFVRLQKHTGDLRVSLRELCIDGGSLRQIIRIGLPAGVQSAVFALSNIVIQAAVNSLGTVAMAASSASVNIESFTFNSLAAFGQACTTFVGQNFGAHQLERCKKSLYISLAEGVLVLGLAIVLVVSTGRYQLAVFNNDPAVVKLGYIRLRLVVVGHICTVIYEVISGYLRGFGISLVPALLTTFGVCVVRVLWVKLVFPVYRTFQSIMIAYPISLTLTVILLFLALLIYHPARRQYRNMDAERR